jgi:hypothetical protein
MESRNVLFFMSPHDNSLKRKGSQSAEIAIASTCCHPPWSAIGVQPTIMARFHTASSSNGGKSPREKVDFS